MPGAILGLSGAPAFRPQTKGNIQRIELSVRSLGGALVDPTTVTFYYLTPAAALVTKTFSNAVGATNDGYIAKDGTGLYRADLHLTEEGVYDTRWVLAGSYIGAIEAKITVTPSNF